MRAIALSAALGALVLLGACDSSCRNACSHVLEDCGVERPGYGLEDCVSACKTFLDHYDDEWQRDASKEAVRCTRSASCEDLRQGTPCYDEAIYIW
jgi:hypothetical protein